MLSTFVLRHPALSVDARDGVMTHESHHDIIMMDRPLDVMPHPRTMLSLPAEPRGILESPENASSEQQDDKVFYDMFQSPCLMKVSNDGYTHHDLEAFSLMCNETFYGGCNYKDTAAIEEDIVIGNVVDWIVTFDYEIYYVGDPIPAVESFEAILMEHLSEMTGLNGCPNDEEVASTRNKESTDTLEDVSGSRSGSDYGYRRRQTKEYDHDFSQEELLRVVAISGEPRDMLDADYNYCIVPVSSAIAAESDCLPVRGELHLYLNNTNDGFLDSSTRLSIESGYQRLIRFGMQQGLYMLGDDVKHVSFIGTRVETGENSGSSSSSDSSVNNIGGDESNTDTNSVLQGDNRTSVIIGIVGFLVASALILIILANHLEGRNAVEGPGTDRDAAGVGDETALSSLQGGPGDEENPCLVVKAPLSVSRSDCENVVPALTTLITARTVEEDDDGDLISAKEDLKKVENEHSESTSCEVSPGGIRVFEDPEDEDNRSHNDHCEVVSSPVSLIWKMTSATKVHKFGTDKVAATGRNGNHGKKRNER